MNAGFMTYLAYDYAADARGFGVGFAAEWYRDDWVLRLGRMSGPKDPNMLPTDFQLGKHYGDQIEVQHNHELPRPARRVRVLAWRNRARLARFADALDYLRGNPAPIRRRSSRCRSEQIKYGVGVNLGTGHQRRPGVFLRAMKADGRTETLAFTETDNSISPAPYSRAPPGAAAATAWAWAYSATASRPRDGTTSKPAASRSSWVMAACATATNSSPKPSTAPVWRDAFVTLDVQRMWNPGYNADRGPANFAALRLHAEF
jgi:hypothetical protein